MAYLIDRVTRGIDIMLACVILAMVGLACLNVALRYIFGFSILWADEALVFALIGVTFIGVISVSSKSQHLKMTLFIQSMPRQAVRIVYIIENAIVAGVCLFVATYSWKVVAMLIKRGTLSNMSNTPLWALHALVFVGLVGIALMSIFKVFQAVRNSEGGR